MRIKIEWHLLRPFCHYPAVDRLVCTPLAQHMHSQAQGNTLTLMSRKNIIIAFYVLFSLHTHTYIFRFIVSHGMPKIKAAGALVYSNLFFILSSKYSFCSIHYTATLALALWRFVHSQHTLVRSISKFMWKFLFLFLLYFFLVACNSNNFPGIYDCPL